MSTITEKVAARLAAGLKKFQPIFDDAHKRDVNESDTVTMVTDFLSEALGYDKYGELTSEHSVRSTFCDLAIKLDGALVLLIEIKAIGLELKDNHVKQAVDYAANQGCEWVALTNGITWQAYQVAFTKPIQTELVLDLNLLSLNHRDRADLELLGLLSREAWSKSQLEEYATQRQALSRFTVAAVMLSDPCVQIIRRELRRISRDVRIDADDVARILTQDVIKREAIEGEKADAARKLVAKSARRALRKVEDPPVPAPAAPA